MSQPMDAPRPDTAPTDNSAPSPTPARRKDPAFALDRRAALAALGATGVGAVFTSAAAARPGGPRPARMTAPRDDQGGAGGEIGWDDRTGKYVLPPLPYPYDALDPHIDEQTMRFHHDRHHQAYVDGLNKAVENLKQAQQGGDPSRIEQYVHDLSFNGGGHINHTLFWNFMTPEGGGEPEGELARQIDQDFGSFNQFVAVFHQAAKSVKGSGWGWLVYEPVAKRLFVTHMHNQEDQLWGGLVPILGVDVWEHAYYLKYGPDRQAYLDAFMNVIDWAYCGQRFEAARQVPGIAGKQPAGRPTPGLRAPRERDGQRQRRGQ